MLRTHVLLLVVIGATSSKSLRLRHFKSDRDKIWYDCSLSKCASVDGVGFAIWRHNFKMAAIASFHAESATTWRVNTKRLRAPMYQRSWCYCIVHSYLLGKISRDGRRTSVQSPMSNDHFVLVRSRLGNHSDWSGVWKTHYREMTEPSSLIKLLCVMQHVSLTSVLNIVYVLFCTTIDVTAQKRSVNN